MNEKLDYKGEELKKEEQKLIESFFGENWDYYDAGNEGFIETSRAHPMMHKIINQMKMDDDTEYLKWKLKWI